MGKSVIQKIIVFTLTMGWLCSCKMPATNIPTSMPISTYMPLPTYTPYPISTPIIVIREFPQRDGQDYWISEALSRDFYGHVDVETDPLIPIQEFRQAYTEALEDGDTWIKDPITVALRYTGYPNVDGIFPSKVFVFSISSNQVIVVVKSENLRDDSVRDHEDRVDLVKVDDVWKIEWAGYRQRCYRSNFEGWTTGLCP